MSWPPARHPQVLVIGPHGLTGGAIARQLHDSGAWSVTTASRGGRSPQLRRSTHVSADLLDPETTRLKFAGLQDVTHLVYAAYTERSTMAETTGPNLAMLTNALDGLRDSGAQLSRVVLIGGGKSYGAHLGAYKTPAKESDPRLMGPIFYNEQEDLLGERGNVEGFNWTVLRPDVVIGPSLGSPMNLLVSIGVYAAISKASGAPLRFPGSLAAWSSLQQFTDVDLLASAARWALIDDSAVNEVFNVLNGDQFRWEQLWPEIAQVFDMATAEPQPMKLVEQMADKSALWDKLVATEGLKPTNYEELTSWPFVDGLLNSGFDMVQSTIKIRQAGFSDCVDSHTSFVEKLNWLRNALYLP